MTKFFSTSLNVISIVSISFILLACGGGFSSNNGSSGNSGGGLFEPIGPGTTVVPTGPQSYEGGSGVYLINMHPDITTNYDKVYFYADLGDVAGTAGTASMRQGGSLTLTFEDSRGNKLNRFFSTGGSTYSALENNFWTTKSSGEPMWRGIFQGEYGAIIMIVDGVFTFGDGLGPDDTMAGSIWFRKWQVISNAKLPTHDCQLNSQGQWDCKNQSAPLNQCWYVSRGPYDCRFQVSLDGQLVTRLPNASNDTEWIKIGEFTDLNKARTFYETY